MTIMYAVLPRRCPIGFEFKYNTDVMVACGRTPRSMRLVGWNGGTPMFSDGVYDMLWSVAMETDAAMAFREVEKCSVK